MGVEADEVFHDAVCQAADNQYFVAARSSMKSNILTGMNLTRNLTLTRPQQRLELVQREHYEIFGAIEVQNKIAAREAMRLHIDRARQRVFEGAISGT